MYFSVFLFLFSPDISHPLVAPVKLFQSSGSTGTVLVHYNGSWGTICDNNGDWDMNDAHAICRQLGYPNATRTGRSSSLSLSPVPGDVPILLSGMNCQGTESSIGQCLLERAWGDPGSGCTHSMDVGVECTSEWERRKRDKERQRVYMYMYIVSILSKFFVVFLVPQNQNLFVRLISGGEPYRGRVQVLRNGTWGGVCGNGFGPADGHVICTQLGYSRSLLVRCTCSYIIHVRVFSFSHSVVLIVILVFFPMNRFS